MKIICKIGFHASSVQWMGSCRRNEKFVLRYEVCTRCDNIGLHLILCRDISVICLSHYGDVFLWNKKTVSRKPEASRKESVSWIRKKSRQPFVCCWKELEKTRTGRDWWRRRTGLPECARKYTEVCMKTQPPTWPNNLLWTTMKW